MLLENRHLPSSAEQTHIIGEMASSKAASLVGSLSFGVITVRYSEVQVRV